MENALAIPVAKAPERAASPISGVVFDVMRYSVHDGPGIRTNVFLKGCPLRCLWCHNPEGQRPEPEISFRASRCLACGACAQVCPVGVVPEHGFAPPRDHCQHCGRCVAACYAEAREWVGRRMTVDQVLVEVLRDAPFYRQSGGGVTFSGGEPLAQPAFLEALLQACRAHGLHTAVETCGFAAWETLSRIAAWTDLFLYDVKLMDDQAHRRFTGVSNTGILENLSRLSRADHAVMARLPVVPGVNDGPENIRATAAFLRDRTHIREVHLLPFHRIGQDKATRLGRESRMPDAETPGDQSLNEVSALFEQEGLRVRVGG